MWSKIDISLWRKIIAKLIHVQGVVTSITNLVAYVHWGKRLLGNMKHHFRDLCKVGALSGSGGKWAILMPKWGEWEILMPWFLHLFVLKFLTFLILALKSLTFLPTQKVHRPYISLESDALSFPRAFFSCKALVYQNAEYMTLYTWHMTLNEWHFTHDTRYMNLTHNTWHMTLDTAGFEEFSNIRMGAIAQTKFLSNGNQMHQLQQKITSRQQFVDWTTWPCLKKVFLHFVWLKNTHLSFNSIGN